MKKVLMEKKCTQMKTYSALFVTSLPVISCAGPVISGCGHPRLHLPWDPAGHGGRHGEIWAGVWLVVFRRLHVWDALWRDTLLRRVPGGDLREDHEPWGEMIYHCVFGICPVYMFPTTEKTNTFTITHLHLEKFLMIEKAWTTVNPLIMFIYSQ